MDGSNLSWCAILQTKTLDNKEPLRILKLIMIVMRKNY